MPRPQLGHNFNQERRGIAAIQSYAAENGLIWRETDNGDIGIDGQLSFLTLMDTQQAG